MLYFKHTMTRHATAVRGAIHRTGIPWPDGEVANTAVCKTAIRGCKSPSGLQQKAITTRKYTVDERFFDVWNQKMAYVFGFWVADGYMTKDKSYRIRFSSADKEILEQIRAALESNNPIRADRRSWVTTFHSRHLFESLQRLGGYRAKSRTVTFPAIPKKYLRDFIRGYFDGDGSVHFIHYTSTKDHRPRQELRSNFTSGSIKFLEELRSILSEELGLPNKVLGVYNGGGSLKLCYGTKDTKKLLGFMYYSGHTIGLKRKVAFAQNM